MAIKYFDYDRTAGIRRRGSVIPVIGKSQFYDTTDVSGLYVIVKSSLLNSEVVTTGWINVEEFDIYYVIGKSTDNGSLKIEFSDEGIDDEVSDGDSIGLTSNSFTKLGGVGANMGKLTGYINFRFLKVVYSATTTASGKPLKVKLLLIR